MVDDLDGEKELDNRARETAAGGDAHKNSTGVADPVLAKMINIYGGRW